MMTDEVCFDVVFDPIPALTCALYRSLCDQLCHFWQFQAAQQTETDMNLLLTFEVGLLETHFAIVRPTQHAHAGDATFGQTHDK